MKGIILKRIKQQLLIVFFIILSSNLFGQILKIIDTKELIQISETYGLDSALKVTKGIPFFFIDKITAKQLILHTKNNRTSYNNEKFLVNYSLCSKERNLSYILHDYLIKKINEINDYSPDNFGGLPRISESFLFALIENKTKQTDSLLYNCYELWNEKSTHYYQNYNKRIDLKNSREKEKLISAYENCQYNCYILQRFLKEMGSSLFSQEKLEFHQHNMAYYLRNGFAIYKDLDCLKFNLNYPIKTILLTKKYDSIGSIDFEKEPELKTILKNYSETYCWNFLIYCNKTAYLDLGCQSGLDAGQGVIYRLELKNKKLIIHEIYNWIS